MRRAEPFCFALLVAVAVLVGMQTGCTKTEDAESSATNAVTGQRTPTRQATSAQQTVAPLQPRITPRPTIAPDGPESDEDSDDSDDSVAVTTEAEPDSGGAPLTVTFVAEVDGNRPGLEYQWDFGDNTNLAHSLRTQHTYQRPGEYTARFTVTGSGVEDSGEVFINVTEEGFDLDIEADPDIGKAPLTVNFRAVLSEEPSSSLSFHWDFGDGGRDASNPTAHTYRLPGTYTAALTAINSQGQQATRDVQIFVDAAQDDAAGE